MTSSDTGNIIFVCMEHHAPSDCCIYVAMDENCRDRMNFSPLFCR